MRSQLSVAENGDYVPKWDILIGKVHNDLSCKHEPKVNDHKALARMALVQGDFMKKGLTVAIAAMSIVALTGSAEAAVTVNFTFSGTGTNPGTVTGKLIFNTTGTNVKASEVYVLSASPVEIPTPSINQNLLVGADFVTKNGFTVSESGIITAAALDIYSFGKNKSAFSIVSNGFNGFSNLNTNRSIDNRDGFSGISFTPATTAAAIPEPATWAMMLVGFGLVGAATRYRRKGVKVRYA